MISLPVVHLKPFEEKRILKGHPWIYKSEIKSISENAKDGDIVLVRSGSNRKIGIGYINRSSEIIVRMLDIAKQENYYPPIDISKFLMGKIIKAIKKREKIKNTEAIRLIFSEADELPGLIADRYKDVLVLQINTLGMEKLKDEIVKIFLKIKNVKYLYEKNLSQARLKEGLELYQDIIYPENMSIFPFVIKENGLFFKIDLQEGTKTGFYIDQRENREKLYKYVRGKKILDCFCFTGAFSCYALKYKAAEVTGIDISEKAIKLAKENMKINNFANYKFINDNVFDVLRNFVREKKFFDCIILDPPAFSKTRKEKNGALKGYIDLLSNSLKILNPKGVIFIFSCSQNIDYNDIMFCIKKSEMKTRNKVKILEKLRQSQDHPIVKTIPETFYLRGLTFIKS